MFCATIWLVRPGSHGAPEEWLVFGHRGTHGKKDVHTDADIWMMDSGRGMVHGGFWKDYLAAQEWILDMQETHLRHGMLLAHCGHSKGGGSAYCAALDTQASLFAFGCPVVGDVNANRTISALPMATRFYFWSDPIVWMPGAYVNSRFKQSYQIGPWQAGGWCLGLGRHRIKSYVKAVGRL